MLSRLKEQNSMRQSAQGFGRMATDTPSHSMMIAQDTFVRSSSRVGRGRDDDPKPVGRATTVVSNSNYQDLRIAAPDQREDSSASSMSS